MANTKVDTYTKEQLIDGMEKYYKEAEENPSKFNDEKQAPKESAISVIEYLLTLIK